MPRSSTKYRAVRALSRVAAGLYLAFAVLLMGALPAARALTFADTGDFNGNGKPSLVAVNYTADSVSVLLNITPLPATKGALISQFRLSSPNGASDHFIKIANATAALPNPASTNIDAEMLT